METNMNKKLVATILKSIPKNIKSVAYLSTALHLSNESVYRRIRGDIPFTTDELTKLALKLKFSIDSIIEESDSERAFFNFYSKDRDPVLIYSAMLGKCNDLLENMLHSDTIESIMALNCLPPTFSVFFDHLFKFTFYKWLHQSNEISFNQNFSDIVIPDELISYQKKIRSNIMKIDNSVLIIDPNIFLNLAKDIQYYYQRRLLDKEDFRLLKKDLINTIDLFENMARTGFSGSEAKISLYLSSLHINANTGYFSYGDVIETLIWVLTVDPIMVCNLEVSNKQKKWLLSLRRHSTLISQSNEILQAEFFDQQRRQVDDI
jgi:hypothetical protein